MCYLFTRVNAPYFQQHTIVLNLIKMQIPAIVCCVRLRPISHSVSLATIGVCVFCATTSVAALFYFGEIFLGFTTQIFTFAFFPISLICYYLCFFLQKRISFLRKMRLADLCVIALSFGFYAWALFDDVLRFCVFILFVYICGCIVALLRMRNSTLKINDKGEDKSISLALLAAIIGCGILVCVLVYYKYQNVTTPIVNFLFKQSNTPKSIVALLGLSFITFSAVSYIVDIYRNKADAGNIIDCALYLSFFPKVVSGPIVLWKDFKAITPEISLDGISQGVLRVMIGFAKKIILADSFGACIAKVPYDMDVMTAWGVALLYMLQIYYDFSGYSDIAIGISKMMGYNFEENFNFPYLSTSITEFWRRWHISLGKWFREYIYFPLGGSRKGEKRTIINIAIVFLLTGIWHGAGFTYMLWGIINGACNIAEKLLAGNKIYLKTPKFIKWFFTMGVTFFCWQIFRAANIRTAGRMILSMFGLFNYENVVYTAQYYFDVQMLVLMAIGIIGATVFGLPSVQSVYKRSLETKIGYTVNVALSVALFILAILFMVNSTYSPFLYFQY